MAEVCPLLSAIQCFGGGMGPGYTEKTNEERAGLAVFSSF